MKLIKIVAFAAALSVALAQFSCNSSQHSTACLTNQQTPIATTRITSTDTCICLDWVESGECADLSLVLKPNATLLPPLQCVNLSKQAPGPQVKLIRLTYADYSDGISTPAGANRPDPRVISNIVGAQSWNNPTPMRSSDFMWSFGQFVAHDMDFSPTNTSEPLPIIVPVGDPYLPPSVKQLPFTRSNYFANTGTNRSNPREQFSIVTPQIDLSVVYGSSSARETCLRTFDNEGLLRTSPGNFLPYDLMNIPNGADPYDSVVSTQWVSGDLRVLENIPLTSMHTLFMREHNRIAQAIKSREPNVDGNTVFARAKAVNIAEYQRVVYEQYMVPLLGNNSLPPYKGYNASLSPFISMEYAQAIGRLHSEVSNVVLRLDNDGFSTGNVPLAQTYFNMSLLKSQGIETLHKGMASQVCQDVAPLYVDGSRNLLFPNVAGAIDLFSVDIQRGRDHGLPSYNAVRAALGLQPLTNFEQLTSNSTFAERLAQAYGSIDDMDLVVGSLAETHLPGCMVGELTHLVLVEQFARSRDADPNFYLGNVKVQADLQTYGLYWLSDIIKANTALTNLQQDVFFVPL